MSKMELVLLSPGSLGDNDGAPFRNEDVQEWSHVDRLTGMLERARVETGRWRTNDQGSARSYGKRIDSRERNSVDGSLVQKARRQVEVFQSQGTGGKSVQVVRASQWSSSRSTDSTFHIQPPNDIVNGIVDSRKLLDCWKLNDQNSMLNELSSYLCRKIHNKVINLNGASTFAQEPAHETCGQFDAEKGKLLASIISDESTSSEDIADATESSGDSKNPFKSPIFLRDCKAPRCLRASTKAIENVEDKNESEPREKQYSALSDIIGPVKSKPYTSNTSSLCNDETGLSNDFVSNGVSTILLKGVNGLSPEENGNSYYESTRFPPVKKSNKTVVHLGNDSFENHVTAGQISIVPKKLEKKVGFSKTEIHFAPDSGKVNIVETDGKPPPTNKFRRRRRSSAVFGSKNPANVASANGGNLPLVHFGDTSYEKYIFGGGKNLTDRETDAASKEMRDEWEKQLKVAPNAIDDIKFYANAHEKAAEPRHRGLATTINFVTNSSAACDSRKAVQGTKAGIQLRFDNSLSEKSSRSILNVGENPLVTRTTKMTVHMPLVMPQVSRPLEYPSFSTLKSVQLILSLKNSKDFNKKSLKNYVSDNDKAIENFISLINGNESNYKMLNSIENGETCTDKVTGVKPEQDRSPVLDSGVNQSSSGIEIVTRETRARDSGSDQDQNQHRKANDERTKNLKSPGSSKVPEKLFSDLVTLKSDCAMEKAQKKKNPDETAENIVTTDSENNHVLMKIVTTHKPTIARVENDHVPKASSRRVDKVRLSLLLNPDAENVIKVHSPPDSSKDTDDKSIRVEDAIKSDDPTYANVFGGKTEGPIYENVSISKTKEAKKIQPRVKGTIVSTKKECAPTEAKKTVVKSGSKAKSKKPVVPISSTSSSVKSTGTKSPEVAKIQEKPRADSQATGSLKEKSSVAKQAKDVAKVKSLKTKVNSVDAKSSPKTATRAKKPVEVVYETAVYNMRNEKLSKPTTKAKESKGPRYINDLICGMKAKRPSKNSTTSNKSLPR